MCEFQLTAFPHYHDYIHDMHFKNGKIEMVYGECQSVRFEACGEYELKDGILTIKNLIDAEGHKIYDRADFAFTKEKGPFILENITANERFIFEKDPFEINDETVFYKDCSILKSHSATE